MMENNMQTPGVYIVEQDAFGNSVVPVPTAVPVFIGYTAQTSYNGESFLNKLVPISSWAEFQSIFGDKPPQVEFSVSSAENPEEADFSTNDKYYNVKATTINYRLYSGIKFFYENGGASCFIMCVGAYDYAKSVINDITDFTHAISLLKKEMDPTILVIPDVIEIMDPTANPASATYLQDKFANAYTLQKEMINHCGEMKNRIAILDIPGGYIKPLYGTPRIDQFRNSAEPLNQKSNSYAAAYYPWLHTTVYQTSEVTFVNINKKSYDVVVDLLKAEFTDAQGVISPEMAAIISAFSANPTKTLAESDSILKNSSASYQLLLGSILEHMNLIAPSAGMAGIYSSLDNSQGVWVAPANVAIQSTIRPSIKIDDEAQQDLNVPLDGKAICAIRTFTGRGVLVWGARTLDGNSNDFRYINVRRTLIYIEQSLKGAAEAFVFSPNDQSTWTTVESMMSNFLTGLWKQGGLVGPKPADAFSVSVGLGSTMTPADIQEGIMRVSIKVAVSHPAEFIEITFEQQMQKT